MLLSCRLLAASVLVLTLSACGGGGGDSGAPTGTRAQIASVELTDGDQQSGTVGGELPVALTARALDAQGAPVVGVVLNFRVTAGEGSVFAGSAATDASGVARERWTLGPRAGVQRLEVRAVDASGMPIVYARFEAVAAPDVPATVTLLAGQSQGGPQTATLATAHRFRVADRFDNPLPGVEVNVVASDAGIATPAVALTGSDGTIETRWTLGVLIGQQSLTASVSPTLSARDTAWVFQAAPGAPTTIVKFDGDQQVLLQHTRPTTRLAVLVTDAIGNPVPGVTVAFSSAPGSGLSAGATAVTDPAGRASWAGFVHSAGVQRIQAVAAGVGTVVFDLNVTATSHTFDGIYTCYHTSPNASGPPPAPNLGMAVTDGVVMGERGGIMGPMPNQTFDEVTGQFYTANFRVSLDGSMNMSGTFTVDANDRAVASGTTEEYSIGRFQGNGSWACERN